MAVSPAIVYLKNIGLCLPEYVLKTSLANIRFCVWVRYLHNLPLWFVHRISKCINWWFCDIVGPPITLCTSDVLQLKKCWILFIKKKEDYKSETESQNGDMRLSTFSGMDARTLGIAYISVSGSVTYICNTKPNENQN